MVSGSKAARLLIVILILAALYFLFPVGLNGLGRGLVREDPLVKSDVIIALGGDKRCLREKRAAELYLAGWARKVVVSGVQYIKGVHTGESAKRYVMQLGVPEGDIIILRETWNTRAEGRKLGEMMRENGWGSVIVVTSPFHSRRAMYTIERAVPGLVFRSAPTEARAPEWQSEGWWRRRGDVYLTVREFLSWANTVASGWE